MNADSKPIYKPQKPTLKFDLGVIALMQIMAMAYGCSVVFAGRPVYVVYNVDRFTLVTGGDIPQADLERAGKPDFPLNGPKIVGARLPWDPRELKRILFSSVSGGADLAQMPQYYLPYPAVQAEVQANTLALALLISHQPLALIEQARATVAAALAEAELASEEAGFLPLRGKAHDLSVLVRRKDGSIVTILSLDPWANGKEGQPGASGHVAKLAAQTNDANFYDKINQ